MYYFRLFHDASFLDLKKLSSSENPKNNNKKNYIFIAHILDWKKKNTYPTSMKKGFSENKFIINLSTCDGSTCIFLRSMILPSD